MKKIQVIKIKKTIKLFEPQFDLNEEKAISRVLKSKFWASGSGSGNVLKFENNFNEYLGSRYCVSVNSGTSALQIALNLFDIKNSEVIVPSLSFVSTANAALYNKAKPVFVDVDPQTLCIDPEKIVKSITKKTKIILPVHFGGFSSNMKEIQKICDEHNLILVEDAAHAAGTKYLGKNIGTHGSAVCFSFHPVKNLSMPTGGAISFNGKNAKKNLEQSKILRWCGITNRIDGKYDISDLGFNAYLNEFSASIGIEQLKKLDKMNSKRKKIAKIYSKEISIEEKMPYDNNCSYHLYWIKIKNRDDFRRRLLQKGIETGIHYLPIHKMSFFNDSKKLPITEEAGKTLVSLPMHPNLSDSEIDFIIKTTNNNLVSL